MHCRALAKDFPQQWHVNRTGGQEHHAKSSGAVVFFGFLAEIASYFPKT
jgi:hypothetical protein